MNRLAERRLEPHSLPRRIEGEPAAPAVPAFVDGRMRGPAAVAAKVGAKPRHPLETIGANPAPYQALAAETSFGVEKVGESAQAGEGAPVLLNAPHGFGQELRGIALEAPARTLVAVTLERLGPLDRNTPSGASHRHRPGRPVSRYPLWVF